MRITIGILILGALAIGSSAQPLPGGLAGAWKGEGTTFGSASSSEMKWEPMLDAKFATMTWRNEWKTRDGKTQVFEGRGVYKAHDTGTGNGWWFDSRGMALSVTTKFDGSVLSSQWGSPETESGRTTYRLIDSDKVEVVDEVRTKDGSWREFGRSVLKRTGGSSAKQ